MKRILHLLMLCCASLGTVCISAQQTSHPPSSVVPFIGCESEGMSGHVDAPSGKPLRLRISQKNAARLAYYSVLPGLSALAPRGWHCIDIYGSNGADLLITPQLMDANAAVEALQGRKLDGPAVVLTFSNGFSSGREEVASVVSRVFPAHLRLVRDAARNAEIDVPVPAYLGPFPGDRLRYRSSESLAFTTPAGRQGIGTLLAPLQPSTQSIYGVQILVKDRGDCCDLLSLSVRLPSNYSDVVPILQREVQRESDKYR
jgi:hypothetical protein